ncbi:smr domain-containing protein [Coccidioides immitis H538.4]|uniref:Smr domain-containing protein n=1 Tax=Coccidioides immitis H538.4 TaxID=396776 RepID=A0A0J8S0I6_COCIT|nr:smr domain-containing protein [Coccidioides immitis H538.4]
MSHNMSYLGPRAFNHEQSSDAEAEYDRLRDLARQEAAKRSSCFERSQQAYAAGDGALAKELSEQGKAHGRKMEEYNRQASQFIFRENNANGRVPDDTIDLHGQFMEEAEDILEERIKYAQPHGQTHLHVKHKHHYPQHASQAHEQQQQQQGNTFVEEAVRRAVPTLLRKLEKACCIVM